MTRNTSRVHSETDTRGVRYDLFIEQDDLSVRGNALASGDDAQDRACEDEILERLEAGDVWAWASVEVRASFDGFEASDYLGGCSYRDTADFLAGGYYEDMKAEALASLIGSLEGACKAHALLTAEVSQ